METTLLCMTWRYLNGLTNGRTNERNGRRRGEQLFAGKENKKLNSGEQFLAGFGAGVLEAIFAVTPIETVKTKAIQTNAPFMQGVKTILKTEGPAGLYQGVWATIAKQGSNQVCVCVRTRARVCMSVDQPIGSVR